MRICCLSDTHSQHRKVRFAESFDVLVHAGDLSSRGEYAVLEDFNKWCAELKSDKICKEVICIAGNHDLSLDPDRISQGTVESYENIFTDCIYLNQKSCTVDGVTFYGDPRTPDFFPLNWAYNVPRGEKLKRVWEKIPESIDVLVTHGPPYGIQDLLREDFRVAKKDPHVGCKELKERVFSMKNLKAHIFGHIHDAYGISNINRMQFVNASICTEEYDPTNPPVMIEVEKNIR